MRTLVAIEVLGVVFVLPSYRWAFMKVMMETARPNLATNLGTYLMTAYLEGSRGPRWCTG